MGNILKLGGVIVVVGGLLGAVYFFTTASAPAQPATKSFGSLAGPDIPSPYLNWGGVQEYRASSGLNQASTTVCTLQSPAATSTLQFASVQITGATTTALTYSIARDPQVATYGTAIGTDYIVAGGAQDTIIASTSPAAGNAVRFAPNTYLNVKYAGANGALNVLVGSCKAAWNVD